MAGCAILILAAGASSRMRGGDKLLEQVAGRPLLRLMLERAASVATGPVLCTLPNPDHPRVACLDGMNVTPVSVPDADEGMGASIRAGIKAMPEGCGAVMIVPADLPDLDADDFYTMLKAHCAHPHAILRAVDDTGTPGHPVVFPFDLFADLADCRGDLGARPLITRNAGRVVTVSLPDRHATTDLDTPEEWAAWRSRQM